MTFYGQDVDNEPPVDPLREEARLHAEAELEGVEEDCIEGCIPWSEYDRLLNEATQAEYERLVELEREAFGATKCDCGGVFEIAYGGCWECNKCGKLDGTCLDDIPF